MGRLDYSTKPRTVYIPDAAVIRRLTFDTCVFSHVNMCVLFSSRRRRIFRRLVKPSPSRWQYFFDTYYNHHSVGFYDTLPVIAINRSLYVPIDYYFLFILRVRLNFTFVFGNLRQNGNFHVYTRSPTCTYPKF